MHTAFGSSQMLGNTPTTNKANIGFERSRNSGAPLTVAAPERGRNRPRRVRCDDGIVGQDVGIGDSPNPLDLGISNLQHI